MIKKSKPLFLSIANRPLDTSKYLDSEYEAKFERMLNFVLAQGKEVIVVGDRNCNYQKIRQQSAEGNYSDKRL